MTISGNVDNEKKLESPSDTPVPETRPVLDDEATLTGNASENPSRLDGTITRPRRRSLLTMLSPLLTMLALALAGYATWRVMLVERSERNLDAEHAHRLDAVDSRITGVERNAERNNALATTLRDQLGETERLQQRMREDVVALADRNARSEALLADLARRQHGSQQQLAVIDSTSLIDQADTRLRLFGDRTGAAAALKLASERLAQAGSNHAAIVAAIDDARKTLADDPRPSSAALLGELDELANALATVPASTSRQAATPATHTRGWWSRQFDRLDHLVTIRREDDPVTRPLPGKDGALLALNRSRLAALEQDYAALPDALRSARASLQACCDEAASAPLLARIDRLLAIDWQAAQPDLGALRARLALPSLEPLPADAPAPATDAEASTDDTEEHA